MRRLLLFTWASIHKHETRNCSVTIAARYGFCTNRRQRVGEVLIRGRIGNLNNITVAYQETKQGVEDDT